MRNEVQCSPNKCSYIYSVSLVVAAVGAINWGLHSVVDFNLVNFFFGAMPAVERVVYTLIGIGGVVTLWKYMMCGKSKE